ncbi:MAG: hypothetical protein GY850_10635 [bacterium]|nr:hypothetical protein [bacterium]
MINIHFYSPVAKNHLALKHLALALIALVFAGCSTPISGRLDASPEVTEMFRNNQILANHQYYISGFQRVPYGIIAIDNKYQFKTSRWRPIDLNSTQLNQLIYRMKQVYSIDPRGAWILDHEDNRLGIWYSSQYQTLVKREKDNRIVVVNPYPPDLRGIP